MRVSVLSVFHPWVPCVAQGQDLGTLCPSLQLWHLLDMWGWLRREEKEGFQGSMTLLLTITLTVWRLRFCCLWAFFLLFIFPPIFSSRIVIEAMATLPFPLLVVFYWISNWRTSLFTQTSSKVWLVATVYWSKSKMILMRNSTAVLFTWSLPPPRQGQTPLSWPDTTAALFTCEFPSQPGTWQKTAYGVCEKGGRGARVNQEEMNPEKKGERHIERWQGPPDALRDTLVLRPR